MSGDSVKTERKWTKRKPSQRNTYSRQLGYGGSAVAGLVHALEAVAVVPPGTALAVDTVVATVIPGLIGLVNSFHDK